MQKKEIKNRIKDLRKALSSLDKRLDTTYWNGIDCAGEDIQGDAIFLYECIGFYLREVSKEHA